MAPGRKVFALGRTGVDALFQSRLRRALSKRLRNFDPVHLGYGDPRGGRELRERLAEHLAVSGVTVVLPKPRFGLVPGSPAPVDTAALAAQWPFSAAPPLIVDVSNPHAVFFVDDLDALDLKRFRPGIERDPLFPNRVNVAFQDEQRRPGLADMGTGSRGDARLRFGRLRRRRGRDPGAAS